MAKQLSSYVHIHTDDGTVVYGPDDSVPAKHAKLITNESAWATEDQAESEVEGSEQT